MSASPEEMQQAGGQAPTVRTPKRLPLLAPYGSRNASMLKDSRVVNGYGEKAATGNDWEVEKRPCLQGILNIVAATSVIGFFAYKRWAYLVYTIAFETARLAIIDLNTMTIAATNTVDGKGFYSFAVAPTALTYADVVMQDGFAGYVLSDTTIPPTLTQIVDPNYPAQTVPGWAALDGTLYVMATNNEIEGSAINDPTTWGALEEIAANADADYPVALAKHLTYVVALKQWTTNFFYDAGNPAPGSPLSPVPDSQVPYGCLSPWTVQEIDGNLIWVTTGQDVAPQVGRLNNLSFEVVSTPAVDRLLQQTGGGQDWYSWTLKTAGHRFYGLTNIVQNFTIVYDLDTGLWFPWTDVQGNCFPVSWMASQSETAYTQYNLAVGIFFGNLWSVQPDYIVNVDSWFFEDGQFQVLPPAVDIYTPSFDGGTRRKKLLNFMFFNGDKTPGSILKSRWNDSDYQSDKWSNFREINLAAVTPTLDKNGTFRRRAYHFRHQCPTPFRISTVDLQLDLGTL